MNYWAFTSAGRHSKAPCPPKCRSGTNAATSFWSFPERSFFGPDILRDLRKNGHVAETGGSSYLTSLYEKDPSFPASLDGMFHGLVVDGIAERQLSSMTDMGCTAFTTTNRRTLSILPQKPKPF